MKLQIKIFRSRQTGYVPVPLNSDYVIIFLNFYWHCSPNRVFSCQQKNYLHLNNLSKITVPFSEYVQYYSLLLAREQNSLNQTCWDSTFPDEQGFAAFVAFLRPGFYRFHKCSGCENPAYREFP